ncbi:flagellar hook-length control protein FliK [Paracoccus lutimaris]|nr:flagellar hook-length control protein FliK [Paracoccus lutimaris]
MSPEAKDQIVACDDAMVDVAEDEEVPDTDESTVVADIETTPVAPPSDPHDRVFALDNEVPAADAVSDGVESESGLWAADDRPIETVVAEDAAPMREQPVLSAGRAAFAEGAPEGTFFTFRSDGRPTESAAIATERVRAEIAVGADKPPPVHLDVSVADRPIRALPIVETSSPPSLMPTEETDQRPTESLIGMRAEISVQVGSDARGDVAAQATAARNTAHAPQNVLRQIALHAADHDGDRIEVTLSPDELGKVRLVILGGERPAVAVYADNPQTLDLLRRHADLLARELRDTGFSGADLSFADNAGTGGRHGAAQSTSQAIHAEDRAMSSTEQPAPQAPPRSISGARIDIRI